VALTVRSRSVIFGDDVIPHSSDGSIRPLLAADRPMLTIHHTGAGSQIDPDDSPVRVRAIETWAASQDKPWEYNWIVDSQGVVWTYAGDHQAAHSKGENHLAHGVLLLGNFLVERPTASMLNAARRLRHELTVDGRLAGDHVMLRHQDMPGANTDCPALRNDEWDVLATPWVPEALPPWDPQHGEFGGWPRRPDKPDIRLHTRGQAVRYLEAVLRHKVGQERVHVDRYFGKAARTALRQFQRDHGLTVDGWCGDETWPVVDQVALD
jgi:peptidoglycan hydrolase-like protein with peptidoglycan-binding domain